MPTSVSARATAAALMLSQVGDVHLHHVRVAAAGLDLRAQVLQAVHATAGQHHAGARRRPASSANCAPNPLDAPVTRATRPDRSML